MFQFGHLYLFQASTKNMKQVCKCHGLSASCAMKTCWRKLPPFNQVAERLKYDRYDRAVLVTMSNNHEVTLQPVPPNNKIEEEDLVYSQASPNYCKKNKKKGSLGTVGRTCDPRSVRLDSCNTLCCGRGYKIYDVTLIENCRCKFKWCCEVVVRRARELRRNIGVIEMTSLVDILPRCLIPGVGRLSHSKINCRGRI